MIDEFFLASNGFQQTMALEWATLLLGFGIRLKGCLKYFDFWSLRLPGTANKERPEIGTF